MEANPFAWANTARAALTPDPHDAALALLWTRDAEDDGAMWLCRSELEGVVLVRAALEDGGYDNFLEQQRARHGGGE